MAWSETGNQLTTTDNVGIGTAQPRSALEVAASAAGALGPVATLTNTGGNVNAASALDFNTFTPSPGGTYNPSSRIAAVDKGNFVNDIVLSSNKAGAPNNGLVERMRIDGRSGIVAIPGELFVSGEGWSGISSLSTGEIAMGDPTVQDTLMIVPARGGKFSVMDGLTVTKVQASQYQPSSILNLVSWAPSALGPVLTLTNLGGGATSTVAIDFTTSAPSAALPTTARIDATDQGNGSSYLTFKTMAGGSLNSRMVITGDGNVGIGAAPASRLHVAGDATVTGDVLLTGADCAEDFDAGEAARLEPGTVVVIGEDGALLESSEPYDKKVAGVVSGAGEYRHGLVLDKRASAEGRVPVALVGKVYCKVDAQYSPIEVGDLLTTASTPGHAMKATESAKAFGAIMGKALKSLNQGRGLIPMLVALQ